MDRSTALAPTAGLLAALSLAPGLASADEASLDPRLGAVLGTERAALVALEPGQVDRLVTALPAAAAEGAPPRPGLPEAQLNCLARALYHEARGEGETGMRAVGEVVLNRAENPRFPSSVCGVVNQGSGNGSGCQFSFVCDGSERRALEPAAWSRARALAREMAAGAPRSLTDGATHFHSVAVRPHWSRVFELTAEIGAHRFYRKPIEVASN